MHIFNAGTLISMGSAIPEEQAAPCRAPAVVEGNLDAAVVGEILVLHDLLAQREQLVCADKKRPGPDSQTGSKTGS
jgi:hypothetical protein